MLDREAFFEKIGYTPLPKQVLYHQSKARFRFPCCGRRFGKSTMAGKDLEPKLFVPDCRYWIVGPTYDLGEKEFRVIWDDLIVGLGLGKDKRIKKAYSKNTGSMWISFPWNTHLEVRSADHPESLVGDALDGVIMSEAAKHRPDTFERFIRPSLSDRRGFADFPTTPEGYNWFYQMWTLGQRPDLDDYESWRFPSWENTVLFPGGRDDPEIQLIEKTTAPEWFMQEIGADFASFVGKIYGEWDEYEHVTEVQFNPAWPNYMAFDWGFTNPLAAIEFQVSPWDEIYVWREHYLPYTRLERHIDMLKTRDQPVGYHLDMAFGDAADPEAAETVSIELVPCMAMPEAKENWREGVDLVKGFLRQRESGETDEYGAPLYKPAFYVDHSCVNVIREFNNYRAPATHGDKNVREAAQAWDDHALDAIRYGLMHLFRLGARHHLADVVSPINLAPRDTNFERGIDAQKSGLWLPSAGDGGFFTMNEEF